MSGVVNAYGKKSGGSYQVLANKDVVNFSVQSDGTYKLTYKGVAGTSQTINKDKPVANGVSTDSKTVYVYYLDNGDSVKTYTGYKNNKTITGATVGVYAKAGENATVVFVDGSSANVTGSSTDLTVIAYKKSNKLYQEKDVANYYSYKAVDAGQVVTINVAETEWNALNTAAGATKFAAYTSMTYDKDNIADLGTLVTWNAASGDKTIQFKNEMLIIGGTAYGYDDDIVVVEVEDDGADLAVIGVKDIAKDNTVGGDPDGTHDPYSYVAFKLNSDGEVDYVVLVKNA